MAFFGGARSPGIKEIQYNKFSFVYGGEGLVNPYASRIWLLPVAPYCSFKPPITILFYFVYLK